MLGKIMLNSSCAQKKDSFDLSFAKDLTDFEDRAFGSVIGAFLGDSIGAYLKFNTLSSENEIKKALCMPGGGPHGLAPGQVTDDSELAICLAKGIAEGLEEGAGQFSLDRIAKWYGYWINSHPFEVAPAIKTATNELVYHQFDYNSNGWAEICTKKAETENKHSETNGGLTRITPLAVFCAKLESEKDVEKVVKAEQKLTHHSNLAVDAAISYCLAVRHIIRNGTTDGLIDCIDEWISPRKSGITDYWKLVQEDKVISNCSRGSAKMSWSHAFIALKRNITSYEEAIKLTLREAGDTDGNAAVVGGLIGARLGLRQLLEQECQKVLTLLGCDSSASKNQQRPQIFSPKHIIPILQKILSTSPKKAVIAWTLKEEESFKRRLERISGISDEEPPIPGETSASVIGVLSPFISKISFKQPSLKEIQEIQIH